MTYTPLPYNREAAHRSKIPKQSFVILKHDEASFARIEMRLRLILRLRNFLKKVS